MPIHIYIYILRFQSKNRHFDPSKQGVFDCRSGETNGVTKIFTMYELCMKIKLRIDSKAKIEKISETWILPFAVLFAMVAYAVLAIVFYNIDG